MKSMNDSDEQRNLISIGSTNLKANKLDFHVYSGNSHVVLLSKRLYT